VLYNAGLLAFQIAKSNFNALELPYKLTFCITFHCQSRCKTCSIWQLKPENELSLEEINQFAQKANFLTWVNITGGEVFLRNDLVEICEAFAKHCRLFLLNFATNGLMPAAIPEKIEKILALSISRVIIGVSIDGPERINDDIRGIKGDWKKAIQTFLALKELEKKHKHFRTYIGYTLSTHNSGKFSKFWEEIKKTIPNLKPEMIHVNLAHHSPHYYYTQDSEASEINKEELDEIYALRKFSLHPVRWLERQYLFYAKHFLASGKTPFPCHAVSTSCYVDSWGNVYPCTIYEKKIGSLREKGYDLAQIIKSNAAEETKQEALNLRCPNCWTPCEAYQILLSNLGKKRL
jgi:MoaA/NifB/PqqE/SkfB family radical SAM enzyme